jgi:hypothetical protein
LSWLPLVEVASPEDLDALMRDIFSPRLWAKLEKNVRQRLVEEEKLFLSLRRQGNHEQHRDRFEQLIVNWSKIAERILQLALSNLGVRSGSNEDKSLGRMRHKLEEALENRINNGRHENKKQLRTAHRALDVLSFLNRLNIQGGKHMTGPPITWENVAVVHAGLYWTLRALLEVAVEPPTEKPRVER